VNQGVGSFGGRRIIGKTRHGRDAKSKSGILRDAAFRKDKDVLRARCQICLYEATHVIFGTRGSSLAASDKPLERAFQREIRTQKTLIPPRRLCCFTARPHFWAWRLFDFRVWNIQRLMVGIQAAWGPFFTRILAHSGPKTTLRVAAIAVDGVFLWILSNFLIGRGVAGRYMKKRSRFFGISRVLWQIVMKSGSRAIWREAIYVSAPECR